MPIGRNSFIQMIKLSNVKGRITYISSHAKQENLYAVYETTERKFWRELAKWKKETGKEPVAHGIRAKLAEKKQEIQNEQKNKQHTRSQNKDRGAR